MKKLLLLLALVIPALAQFSSYGGNCEQGGNTVVTSGFNSSNYVQQSFPACTVTVYFDGTSTLATIYSDSSGDPLANPFVAAPDGSWTFYAASGNYQMTFSGAGILIPYTRKGSIGTGGGGAFKVLTNGLANTTQISLNLINSSVTNGLQLTFTNTSGGTDQLGLTGQLTSSGMSPTGVAGSYTNANITTDAAGRIIAASTGTSLLPTASSQLQYLRTTPDSGRLNSFQFASLPEIFVKDYIFPSQTPGGTLTPGSNVISMAPCPLGVTGTDLNHYLYISGGVGLAEAVLITGGTCAGVGVTSGTVIVTTGNSHSGAWAIQSATSGIAEAYSAFGPGFRYHLTAGLYNVFAPTTVSTVGGKSIIFTGDGYSSSTVNFGTAVFNLGTGNIFTATGDLNAGQLSFEDMQLAGTLVSGNAISCNLCFGMNLQNVFVNVSGGDGITCTGCIGFDAINTRVSGSGGNGISLLPGGGGGGGYTLNHVYAYQNCQLSAGPCAGIFITNALMVDASGLDLEGNGQRSGGLPSDAFGLEIVSAFGVSIRGSYCERNLSNCIYLGSNINSFDIAGNYMEDSGLYVESTPVPAANGTIHGNYFMSVVPVPMAITGVVNNFTGIGFCEITTATPHLLSVTAMVNLTGIGGANCNGQGIVTKIWTPNVFDITIPFSGTYTSGGTVLQMSGIQVVPNRNIIVEANFFQPGSYVSGADLQYQFGPAIPSATTIAPTNKFHHVTGTTPISTITPPSSLPNGFSGTFCAIPDGSWNTTTAGNIDVALTATIGLQMCFVYDLTTLKWYPTGGGGGGGASFVSQLGDFIATTTGSVQTLGTGCSTATPCNIRVGNAILTVTSPITLTLVSGTTGDDIYWYATASGVFAGYNSANTYMCSGCTAAASTIAFPDPSIAGAVPLWHTTVTSGSPSTFTAINEATMDKRAMLAGNAVSPGSGVVSANNPSTGVQTLSTDPTQVPVYSTGSGAPSGTCTAGRAFYTDLVAHNLYWCDATNTWAQANGGSSTLTASYIMVPLDTHLTDPSDGQTANTIWCYDFPLSVPTNVTTSWQYIFGSGSSGVYGVAIYDANGNRLTAATQTGTASTGSAASSVALGGGTITLNPGALGRFSLCYTSNAGTALTFGGTTSLSSYFASSTPIFYTVANISSTAGTTITWPATLGAKTKIANASAMATTLLLP